MRKIVAIGGGDLASGGTLPIDEWVVKLTDRPRPRALFVPTASRDSAERSAEFSVIYGGILGCEVRQLLVAARDPLPGELAEPIAWAELIYVGGGDTLFLLERWRALGIDLLLRGAAARGTVLAGMSAGANCWFHHGLTDAQKFYFPDDWRYLRVRGLGLIPALGCPHYKSQAREAALANEIAKTAELAVALDDRTALVVYGERCRIVKCQSTAEAYRVYSEGFDVVTEVLEESRDDYPLLELLSRGASPRFPRLARRGLI